MANLFFSTTAKDDIEEMFLGAVPFSSPAEWEIGLWIGDLDSGAECVGTGYARCVVDNDSVTWQDTATGSGVKSNLIDFRWPAAGNGTGDWGDITGLAFYRPADSTPYFVLPFENAVSLINDQLTLAAGIVQISRAAVAGNGLSELAAERLLDLVFGATAWSPPANWEAALFYTTPEEGGLEVAGTSYARVTVDNDDWEPNPGGGRRSTAIIKWPASGNAGSPWGEPGAVVFFVPGETDPMLVWSANGIPFINTGDNVEFPIGNLIWDLLSAN
jgi:hypothetical protein